MASTVRYILNALGVSVRSAAAVQHGDFDTSPAICRLALVEHAVNQGNEAEAKLDESGLTWTRCCANIAVTPKLRCPKLSASAVGHALMHMHCRLIGTAALTMGALTSCVQPQPPRFAPPPSPSEIVRSGRLYPANDLARPGGVLSAQFTDSGTGHGSIEMTMADGEVLKGE
jgi:hypothetical protein